MVATQAKQSSQKMRIRPMTPAIGAELLDVDLAHFDDQLVSDIRAALLEYKVVFFRDQDLTRAQHIDFARAFGDL